MAKRRMAKSVTFRLTPTEHTQLPELCRLHGNRPLSAVLRRLLRQELARLKLATHDGATYGGRRYKAAV